MRILLNGWTTPGHRTGIGWYTLNLGAALEAHDQVEMVGVALKGRIASVSEAAVASSTSQSRLASAARSSAAELMPARARQLLWRLSSRTMLPWLSHWHLYHETNYIAPSIPMPVVTTVHDLSFIRCPQFLPNARRRWLASYLENSLTQSHVIISVSRFTRDELLDCFSSVDPSRVVTTPLGVDHQQFHPRRTVQEEMRLRAKYRLPKQFVLFLGTVEPRKNVNGLLRAYALLPERCRREFPLVLAGQLGRRQRGVHQAALALRSQGCLQMLGYVPQADVAVLMRAASVFCFPSHYEGFGLPALEAAACGTPVVCAGAGSLPEVMGNAARYVDPHSPESIADGLVHLFEDESYRETLTGRSCARAARFTWSRCADETFEAYSRAA